MFKIKSALLALLIFSPLTVLSAHADEITKQVNMGLEAYKEQDYKAAIEELNFAIAQLRELLAKEEAKLMPEPLDGWKAEAVENTSASMAMLGGGTSVSRKYTKGDLSVKIELTSSPMVSGMLGMMNNPAVIGADPKLSPYRFKRKKGTLRTSGNQLEINLVDAGQILIKVSGRKVSKEILEQYLAKLDFKAIRAAMLND